MKLKTLEITGFKSFAERTKIEFMPGITGVVGPNGSGKSNIIEAIRWVMGEQSAKGLRGDKMADVIFGGTSERSPLNRAEVAITFDNTDHYLNSDYSEITITRTLYRNGDSNYQINGVHVRLKDIHELFMDSGLGRESFSIISQGRVESIFSAKPVERRSIIEDVAGVYKYKQNKDKAEKELGDVHDNLTRIADILYELQGRVEPLAQESAKAQDYLTTKASYDQLDQSRIVLELLDWYQEKDELTKKLTTAQTEYDKQQEAVNIKKKELQKFRQEQLSLTEQQQKLQEVLVESIKQVEKLTGEQNLQSERRKNRTETTTDLSSRLKVATERLASLESNYQQCLQKLADQQSEYTHYQQSIEQANENHPRTKLAKVSAEIEQVRHDLVATMQDLTSAKNKQNYLVQENERSDAESLRLQQRKAKIEQRLSDANNLVDKKNNDLQQAEKTLNTAQESFETLKKKGQALEQQRDTERQAWFTKMEQEQRLSTRLQSLQHLSENYDGYYQGVKNLMKAQQQFEGIQDVVANLISVDDQHRIAIETALGSALQHVVVKNEQVGKAAIQYLAKHRLGRVTFLPQTTLKARHLSDYQMTILRQSTGFVGIASDLVTTASAYQNIIANLLGTTVIVTDMSAAIQIAKELQYRVRLVTLDGQVMNAGGSMTGGATRQHGNGLLSQKTEIDQLTLQEAELHQATLALEQQVKQIDQQLQKVTEAFNQQQAQVLKANEQFQTDQASLQLAESTLKQVKKEQAALQYDYQLVADVQDKKTSVDQNEQAITDLSVRQQNLQKALDDYLQQQSTIETEIVQADQQISDFKSALAKAEAVVSSLVTRKNDLLEQKNAEQSQIKLIEQQINDLAQDENDVQERLTQQLEDVQRQKATAEQSLATLKFELEQVQEQHDTTNSELGLIQDMVSELMTSISQYNGRLGELRSSINTNEQTLETTYDTSFEFAKSELLNLDISTIRTKLKLLKQGLDEIGHVNLNAIDEYQTVKERYDFLMQQQQDLIAAKDNLQETMSEMDTEVITRFRATFDAIAEQFAKIFVKMFGGGQASLILTDPDHLLTTGIDIKAQPPGKKFQQMSLLSGGEKALTAISLLFAILAVRPVPFAILDETEAALDEANVDRFAHYLHEVNHRTQFIVITHRKGTMTETDVLYGVTMQEPGVSTMVSVSLTDLDDTMVEN
ncbi:chromosome segregation protein SMC [Weissella paramesenteroides]|jgi:chromosome segregation protein|uniref:chromosome segregation protein SMC n=1 Tax=Weissella paramesenteroides TaxID=1249 RepID=UPI002E7B725A|nr:chromosome segregation protein SMC [Weissella paramesenteroides]WPQ67412.1 chromosome segregation protein SMC [Weissella paramesenteroides]